MVRVPMFTVAGPACIPSRLVWIISASRTLSFVISGVAHRPSRSRFENLTMPPTSPTTSNGTVVDDDSHHGHCREIADPVIAFMRISTKVTCVLELSGVSKRYRDVVALDELSLRARRGRILGFLGPNGAGKTTAMRSVFGLVDLDAGSVTWDGARVTTDTRLRFGYMPEQRGLYRRMPAGKQLAFMGQLHGMARADALAAAAEWLARLGLGDRGDDLVSDLSHGNQQRVQLAAALVHDPDLLVLDEPFSGLDPLGVTAMTEVLVQRAAQGAAVVFSSHQLDLVEDVVDDVVIIANGRDRLSGTLDQVRASTGSTMVTFRLAGEHPEHLELPSTTRLEATTSPPGTTRPTTTTTPGIRHARDGNAHVSVPVDSDPAVVLAALQQLDTVERFSFEPPSLSHVFRDVVGMTVAEAEAASQDASARPDEIAVQNTTDDQNASVTPTGTSSGTSTREEQP